MTVILCSSERVNMMTKLTWNAMCAYSFNIKSVDCAWEHWVGVTVKPVCNDHLYDKIYYLWFIQ